MGRGKRSKVGRRVATPFDQLALSLGGTAVILAWGALPAALAYIPWIHPGSPQISWVWDRQLFGGRGLDAAFLCATFHSYLFALRGLKAPRLRLTRPLFGALMGVVATCCIALTVVGLGGAVSWAPLGLAALWVASSFGTGAGLTTLLASLAAIGASGVSEIFDPTVAVRGVTLVLLFRGHRSTATALRAGLIAGVVSSLTFAIVHQEPMQSVEETLPLAALSFLGALVDVAAFWITFGAGERLLGHVSRERLVALLDLSHPLLKRMIERAPGSFEHSRAMANLAEQAASSIGADALLTRVGAYYHDLGKSVEPKFFVENLVEGETSPHASLTPAQSVEHIVGHVTAGVQILREAGIPEPIVEFSYTHHGTQFVEYFLNQERKRNPEVEPDLEAFAYPGMRPSTKETAILMLVDSIEAASRTIDASQRDKIKAMVWRIIFSKLASGQLDDSRLTMSELRIVSARVVETLVHMNHHRIKYPWQEDAAPRNPQSSETRVREVSARVGRA